MPHQRRGWSWKFLEVSMTLCWFSVNLISSVRHNKKWKRAMKGRWSQSCGIPRIFSPSFCFVRVPYLTESFTVPKHLNSLFFFFFSVLFCLSFFLFFLSFFFFSFPLPTYIQTVRYYTRVRSWKSQSIITLVPQSASHTVHTVGPAGGCFSRFSLTHPSTLQLALSTARVWLRNAQAGR